MSISLTSTPTFHLVPASLDPPPWPPVFKSSSLIPVCFSRLSLPHALPCCPAMPRGLLSSPPPRAWLSLWPQPHLQRVTRPLLHVPESLPHLGLQLRHRTSRTLRPQLILSHRLARVLLLLSFQRLVDHHLHWCESFLRAKTVVLPIIVPLVPSLVPGI